MSDDMCQPRQEIIDNDPQLQKAIKELEKLQAKEGNGKTRQEILEYEVLIETRIQGLQTQQDVSSIKGSVETIVERLHERDKFPSIIYQLMKLPLMGWSLLLSSVLGVWLIGQLTPPVLIKLLGAANVEVTAGNIHAVVAFLIMSLIVIAARRYVAFVDKCDEKKKAEKSGTA